MLDCEAFVPIEQKLAAAVSVNGDGEIGLGSSSTTTSRDVADNMLSAFDNDKFCQTARRYFFERGRGSRINTVDDFFANTFIMDSPVSGARREGITCPSEQTANELQDASEVDMLCRCSESPLMYRIYVTEQVCENYKTATQIQIQGIQRYAALSQFQTDRSSILSCNYGDALRRWCLAAGHPLFMANITGLEPTRNDYLGSHPIPPASNNLARADFENPREFVQYQCAQWCSDNCSVWPKNVCGLDDSDSLTDFNNTCTCQYSASLASILIIPFAIALACVLMLLYGSCGPGRRRLEKRLGRFKNFEENLEAVKNPICEL